MNETVLDQMISMAAALIISSIKDKAARKKLKAVMLKIRNKINEAYIGDKDFDTE